jgi:Lrp/AsnC family leucine-responsive transcriptional regulator
LKRRSAFLFTFVKYIREEKDCAAASLMDETDTAILQVLQKDSRLSTREIGKLVYLSAPAVRERIRHMEDQGIILGYSIRIDQQKIAPKKVAYIAVIVQINCYQQLSEFFQHREEVSECYRVSGENACYLLRLETIDDIALNRFTMDLQAYGNYRLYSVTESSIIKRC